MSDALLREALKRCSPATYEAARRFRTSGHRDELPTIIHGVIERYIDREHRAKLLHHPPGLRLIEDLGIDSLTLMEIVMLAEEVLPITIENEELSHLRTLGEIEQFISSHLRGLPPSKAPGAASWNLGEVRRSGGPECPLDKTSSHSAA